MTELVSNERAVAFLRDERRGIAHKIDRLSSALDNCDDCLEGEGLQAMLRAARLERDVINELLAYQQRDDALSLEAQIVDYVKRLHETARRKSLNWRRGKRTPDGYWDAEMKQIALNTLLRRFHAWTHGENVYERHDVPIDSHIPQANGKKPDAHAHPWYTLPDTHPDNQPDDASNGRSKGQTGDAAPRRKRRYSRSAEMLYEDIVAALDGLAISEHHLEIIAEPLGQIIVMGYSHDEAQKRRILDTLLAVDGVFEVIEDIKIASQADCPVCRHADIAFSEAAARRNGQRHQPSERGRNGRANGRSNGRT